MKQRRITSKHHLEMSGSVQPDDGMDPRYDTRGMSVSRKNIDRRAAQLCVQVRRALEFIVPETLVDSTFDAIVLDVQPAPNTGHLLVVLQPVEQLDESSIQQLHLEIVYKAGFIRTAMAQSIQRRNAPTLTFRIVPS